MSKRNFFKELRVVKSSLDSGSYFVESIGDVSYKESTKEVFSQLVCFVESCTFSSSKHIKFICKNWYMDYDELTSNWNSFNSVQKTQVTFRSQVSTASSLLFQVFPMFSSDIFVREDLEQLELLKLSLEGLDVQDSSPKGLFVSEVCNYCDPRDYKSEFDLSVCSEELKLLKLLMKSSVFSIIDTVDVEKFAFLLRVLSEPLTSSKSRQTNVKKLEVLKALGCIGSDSSLFDFLSSQEVPETQVVEKVVKKPFVSKYKLGINQTLEGIIESRFKKELPVDDLSNSSSTNIENLRKYLNLFTEEEFRSRLDKANLTDLSVVLDEFKKE